MDTQIKRLGGLTGMPCSAMAPTLPRTTAPSLTRAASVPRPSPSENVLSVPGSTTGVAGGNAPPHVSGVSSKAVTEGATIGANTKAARLETGSAAVAASTSAPHHTAEAILALPSRPRPGVVPNPVTWAGVVTAAGVSFTMPQSSTIVAPVDPILRQSWTRLGTSRSWWQIWERSTRAWRTECWQWSPRGVNTA